MCASEAEAWCVPDVGGSVNARTRLGVAECADRSEGLAGVRAPLRVGE